ncbi:MAG TPA: hypothetical protein VHL11_10740, partial [Phototrophicaceae bacterium]|nr:hypothetical protein [Phototrophicaceae bacterium]
MINRINRWSANSLLTVRQQLIIGYFFIILLVVAVAAIAIHQQNELARFAAVKEAEQVGQLIEYFVTDTSNSAIKENADGGFSFDTEKLQVYIQDLHNIQNRDMEVIDTNKIIISDVFPDDVGSVFEDDQNDEVAQTIKDGQPRTFVEISEDYPEGIDLIVIPLDLSSGEVIGAMIVEYTPLYN